MLRRIVLIVVALLVAGVGLGPGGAATASPRPAESAGSGPGRAPAVVTEVQTVTIDMDCAGFLEEVSVTVRLPRTVGAGQAFTIAELSTTQMGGSVHLGLSNTSTGALSVPAYRPPSTVQLVATGRPGQRVAIHVTGATHIGTHDGEPPLVSRTDCTPVGDTQLGSVLIGRLPRRGAATGAVDVAVPLTCRHREGFDVGGEVVHVSFTAPTRLRPGDTFALPDLSPTEIPAGGLVPGIYATGTNHATTFVSPSSTLTVTAAPGETVDLVLHAALVFGAGEVEFSCSPVTSGHLASVPVAGRGA